MYPLILASLALLPGCPFFSEFLADPQSNSDTQGEYVEIAWDAYSAHWDTLYYQLDDGETQVWLRTADTLGRLLLHRSAPSACPNWNNLSCVPLRTAALPNSRASRWTLAAGICRDTADLPMATPGIALQRSGIEPWNWAPSRQPSPPERTGTPGLPDTQYETDIEDCIVRVSKANWNGIVWHVELVGSGCTHSETTIETHPADGTPSQSWKLKFADGEATLPAISSRSALWMRIVHSPDGNPANDTVDTLLTTPESSPLQLSEVAPCPQDPAPEWFEITNIQTTPFPIEHLNSCGPEVRNAPNSDSIAPGASILVGNDTTSLRTWLGIPDIVLIQMPIGNLRNSTDTLRLCWKNALLDSIVWNAETPPPCPSTLDPNNPQQSGSPAYIPLSTPSSTETQKLQIAYRILSASDPKSNQQIRWETNQPGILRLFDRRMRRLFSQAIPAAPMGTNWQALPHWRSCSPGPCFIQLDIGSANATVHSFIVRP